MSTTTYNFVENYLRGKNSSSLYYPVSIAFIAQLLDTYESSPLNINNVKHIYSAITNHIFTQNIKITPWDIQDALWSYPHLASKYHINNSGLLPVTITFDKQSFIHNLSKDFTFGMLFYSFFSKNPLSIYMFDRPFFFSLKNTGYDSFCTDPHKEYAISINSVEYCFLSLDFLQGWNTAKNWSFDTSKLYDYVLKFHTNEFFEF